MYYYTNNSSIYNRLYESASGDYSGNTAHILRVGKIPMFVPKLEKVMDVELKPIVQCVEKAIAKVMTRYKFMAEFIRYNRTMYVLANPSNKNCIHKTMAVDSCGNLWLNVHFIYNDLNNDTDRVFGIIFHELMHNFLNHIERSANILPMDARKKLYDIDPQLLEDEDLKQNLCQDLEVNLNMVADGVVSKDFWVEMHGMYDEKYLGMTFEEIYKNHGDEVFKDYKLKSGVKMDDAYYEALKAIVKALKVLNDPSATDADKEKAAAELEDIINKLFGERVDKKKKTIRRALQKIQKTRIKEIGEIGPALKKVIDDLAVSPKSMTSGDLMIFKEDVDGLEKEMLANAEKIADTFKADSERIKDDVPDCFGTLKTGVEEMHNPDIDKIRYQEVEAEVIFKIEKLLADDIKTKALADELKKKKEELEEKKKKAALDKIEKIRRRHILYKYYHTFENLSYVYDHERASEETHDYCLFMMDMIKPLLDKPVEEITSKDVDGYAITFSKLKKSLRADLQKIVDEKILRGVTSEYLDRLVDDFERFNLELMENLEADKKPSETELGTLIQNAIDSIRLIGKRLHTMGKFRPSDEYREAYKEEFEKLKKIYKELGKKGLRKELGLPSEEDMAAMTPEEKEKIIY